MEDPSDNFVRLRDYVDAFNCMKLASFQAEVLKKGWSEEMAQESQEKLKMSRKQARRIYEILRLRATNLSDGDEYKAYRLDVKNRLNAPFQKQKSDQEKLQKSGALSEAELKATNLLPKETRLEQLHHQYKELEEEYRHVITRLDVSML